MVRSIGAALAVLLSAPGAFAYNEAVHAFVTKRALASRTAWLAEPVIPPNPPDHDAFRARFWLLASQTPDAALRAEFLKRFPTAASLDAWSFKEFLMLDPAATVHGLDPSPEDLPGARGDLLPLASRWPDDDERNRHRYLRDEKHQIIKSPDGQPVPDDPATLWMGSLTGASSQGHAHYGLLPPPLSDDPAVLKKDPRHFGIPPNVQTWGVEFAQLYADLSLLAKKSDLRSGPWLADAFAGASFHHVEDVANQIHTIQVGIYDFFQAAFLQSKERDLKTLGGLFGPRASLQKLGLRLVANHHLLLEDLFAHRIAEAQAGKPQTPEISAALSALDQDDESFAAPARAAIEAARAKGEGEIAALMRTLIDQSSLEGPDCYRLIWQVSAPTLRDGMGHEYLDNRDNPDQFVDSKSEKAKATLAEFYALEGKGLRRAATAVRLWEASAEIEANKEGAETRAVERSLRMLLAYHREAEVRRASYVPEGPAAQQVAWGWPAGAIVLLLAIALVIRRVLRKSS